MRSKGDPLRWSIQKNVAVPTIFTSDMLSMLSTWTSMPTGIAEPAKKKGQTAMMHQL